MFIEIFKFPCLPIRIPQLLQIRAFDMIFAPQSQDLWFIDPFTRGIDVATTPHGDIASESEPLLEDDVVHWAKLVNFNDYKDLFENNNYLKSRLENGVLLISEGHSFNNLDANEPTTMFRITMLRKDEETGSYSFANGATTRQFFVQASFLLLSFLFIS